MGISFSSLMTRIRRSTASSPLVVDIMKVEDAEVRQKIKTMETLEKKLEFLHRQRAVVSEQATANMNGKRQNPGEWKWTKLLKRTEEINKAFANEVSWDRASTSSTQAPTHRPSERTYGAI
uniref:Uncharacterized protein n=1 Tax=Brassica oleracea var. oleracea TaxID=109376 RepID=A0A0D3A9M9_BRAOL